MIYQTVKLLVLMLQRLHKATTETCKCQQALAASKSLKCKKVTVVLLVDNHLWGQVIQRAAEGVSPRCWRMDRPPEIRDLQCVFQANQDILRLDVPMDDVLGVAILDGLAASKRHWVSHHLRYLLLDSLEMCPLK